jgi:hypothetical protein
MKVIISEAGMHEVTISLVAKFGWEGPRSSPGGAPREDKSATVVDNLAHRVDARQYARP